MDRSFLSGEKGHGSAASKSAELRVLARNLAWACRQAWNAARGYLIGLISITLLQSIFPAALAWVAKSLIDSLTTETGSSSSDSSPIMPWLIAGLIITLLEAVTTGLRVYLTNVLSDKLNLRLTTDILTHASELDIEFFEDVDKQDTLERAKRNTGSRFVALISGLFGTISSVLQVVTLSGVLVVIQPWTLVVIVIITPPYMVVRWRLACRQYGLEYNRMTKRRWNTYFTSLLTGRQAVAETRLLGLAPLLLQKFRSLEVEFHDQNRGMYRENLRGQLVFSVVAAAGFYGLLVNIVLRALGGTATLGDVAVFFGASARLRAALMSGIGLISMVIRDSLQVAALIEFYENKPSLRPTGKHLPPEHAGAIKIENVDFSYPGSSKLVLQDLSLEIQAGETVALVGENGCGKTTLAKLLANLYAPCRGRITLDGHDINKIAPESLRQQISFVFQNYNRYEATAADNIAYGDWENCLDNRERIEEIARAAGIHDMLMAMPNGYDTLLGRKFGALDLSGGQWQKLAVARAFARRASLLILDEPTASLDARAEYDLFLRARELARGRTTILISHRFSTVSIADRILVLDQGTIIEAGSHQELLRSDGQYASLYRLHQVQTGAIDDHGDTLGSDVDQN